MVLIKSSSRTLEQNFTRLIWFYRRNPIIAAKHLLRRNGKPIHLFPYQCAIINNWWTHKFNQLTASRGAGKANRHGTKVLTPSGFRNIEDIEFGDKVITPTGEEASVQGVFPQGEVDLVKITFYDGRSTTCCKDHLWKIYGVKYRYDDARTTELVAHKGWNVIRTDDLIEYFNTKAKKHHNSLRVPLVEDSLFSSRVDNKELTLHPYVLGALIGDGNYTQNHVAFSSADSFIVDKLQALLPKEVSIKKANNVYDHYLRGVNSDNKALVRELLLDLGIHGQKSHEKAIPQEYLNLNRGQTLQLLQGLFDTDGTTDTRGGRVSYSTTSEALAEQVQTLIWKLGGICKISPRITSYTYKGEKKLGRKSYRLYVRFKDKTQLFSLPRKKDLLKSENQYSANLGLAIVNIEEAPKAEATCISIDSEDELFIVDDYVVTHNTFLCSVFVALRLLLYPGERLGIFAPSYRQAKLIFEEFIKLVDESPILRECIDKMPTKGNDMCVCKMKRPASGMPAGYVMALPVGTDGAKIRGLRFDTILIDECVQLPELIFDSVIFPMLSTALDPVASVMEAENRQKLIDDNPDLASVLNSDEGRQQTSGGSYIAITSGYYQFNYWWPKIVNAWKDMQANGNRSQYSLTFVPWQDLPDGFLNKNVVMDAMTNNPSHMFLTEWAAEWISDSAGAFPMSLLTQCRDRNLIPYSNRDPIRHKGSDYVFGIDVARDRDSTTICVIELGHINKIVHVVEIEGGTKTYQEQAAVILDLAYKFTPVKIYMDAGGGHGTAIQDLLAKPDSLDVPAYLRELKIISEDESLYTTGRRILTMCDFSNQFIADANNNAKLLLEQGLISLPDCDNPIMAQSKPDLKGKVQHVDLVQKMIDQIASIVITKTGVKELPRYDLPKTKASAVSMDQPRKDLYTAFILAAKCTYDLNYKPREDLHMPTAGVITEIGNGVLTPALGSTIIDSGRISTPSTPRLITGSSPGGIRKIRNGGVIVTRDGRGKGWRRK